MANPQQPELRRSERVPSLEPDATEAARSAQSPPSDSEADGPVPEDQRPGHHPDHEQDQPDAAAFAERLGVVPEGDEPRDAPDVTGAAPRRVRPAPIGVLLLGPVVALAATRAIVRFLRRRR